ncbi:MAG: periplasmic heavy metal sensor [Acidobacteria bacterium]|nr:periplasmic heavy metal sensor [Acidobacteriota bacterium]
MNTIKKTIASALLAAFALAAPASAQRPPHEGAGATMSSSRLDFLAGYLGLTDSQKSQAKSIFDAASTASTTAQGQLAAARDALTAAVKTNAADTQLDRLAAAVGTVHGQIEAIRAKANAKFYALFTAEQKTKFDALGNRGQGGIRGGD